LSLLLCASYHKSYDSHAPSLIERHVNSVNPACQQFCWQAGF
jgi:hypothetical protein